ncbi:MAG: DEAD/DEAH box helicase [Planctomycetota bacterium]
MKRTDDSGPPLAVPGASRPAWVVLEASGLDVRLDHLTALRARKWSEDGLQQHDFAWQLEADAHTPAECTALAAAALTELAGFLGDVAIVTVDARLMLSWVDGLLGSGRRGALGAVIGLFEAERLVYGRAVSVMRPPTEPEDLEARVERLGAWLDANDQTYVGLWTHGLLQARHQFQASDREAAARLGLLLGLLDRGEDRNAGPLTRGLGQILDPEHSILALQPRGALLAEHRRGEDSLPTASPGISPFFQEDKVLLREIFGKHLPAAMAETMGGDPADYLRPSQLQVAEQVADNLGKGGLLLVHAPTGTGKTLAYIVPALLWSLRHGIRVGVATYTRALQEQAMNGEVPRALNALRRAGIETQPKVALLKGRENYLCWRAFTPLVPEPSDDGETWLAWTSLLTFAWCDEAGDLDHLDTSPPLVLTTSAPYRDAMARLVRAARARKGCCTKGRDRASCLADLARGRAEQSHLVITNQSLVLARQEFLRHVIFDECEHLHTGAISAWSHHFEFQEVRRSLMRLGRPDRSASRTPIARLRAALPLGAPSRDIIDSLGSAWQRCLAALDALEEAAIGVEQQRLREFATRDERDLHGYLREAAQQGALEDLLHARRLLGKDLSQVNREVERSLVVL